MPQMACGPPALDCTQQAPVDGAGGKRSSARRALDTEVFFYCKLAVKQHQQQSKTFPVTNFGDFITHLLILHACKNLPSSLFSSSLP